MTPQFQPDEKARRREVIFRRRWELVAFFGGLALCLAVVLASQYFWA